MSSFAWYSPCTWLIISWESPKTWMFYAPIWWARVRPAIRASYSLLWLVALKLHLTALEAVFPVDEVSTIPTPAPLTLLDPSTSRIHSPSSLVSPRRRTSCSKAGSKAGDNSATKSARTCDFIAVVGRNITSYSPSSTAHFARRLETSGLWRTNFTGKEVTTTIG